MHWVDMEWLWGYEVLPSSVEDMLNLCESTGAKANINFDGIGYEKLAYEAPATFQTLREAVQRGQVEIVGGSYGQPYGLFHGGESNIRQRVYGVRTIERLFGVRPVTFWEEEFDFFPQLPQILVSTGYRFASLFYQWTWHTPHVPTEPKECSAVWWEGIDGSRLLTAPRNSLNLHQWPEDFDDLLKELDASSSSDTPLLILQWLELMPSTDWMCRSELILPPLRKLLSDPRFEVRFVTLSEFLQCVLPASAPLRKYELAQVFHGVSLGKNGDRMRRLSRKAEHCLLAAESAAAVSAFLGRPYARWDVYPLWELEESWRELLAAQHHDNDECEGLCGSIGIRSYERSIGLSSDILCRTLRRVESHVGAPIVYNPLGWSRSGAVIDPTSGRKLIVRDVPAFGFCTFEPNSSLEVSPVEFAKEDQRLIMRRGDFAVVVDCNSGKVVQIVSRDFPDGVLGTHPLLELQMRRAGKVDNFEQAEVFCSEDGIVIKRRGREGAEVCISLELAAEIEALDVRFEAHNLPRPDGGMNAALCSVMRFDFPYTIVHDHPYGVSKIRPQGSYTKKYPSGDWMTSPQWFEQVHNPFTSLQLIDFDGGNRGLLVIHDGSQQLFESDGCIRQILTMYDPWDEEHFYPNLEARFRFIPHGRLSNVERWKLAQETLRPLILSHTTVGRGGCREIFSLSPLHCISRSVVATAFYRERQALGVEYPYVLRLVEFDGAEAEVTLLLAGKVASARKTNLLGETLMPLTVEKAQTGGTPDPWSQEWSQIRLKLKPFEIGTLYLDLEMGRKQSRRLDDYRNVWATVHKLNESSQ